MTSDQEKRDVHRGLEAALQSNCADGITIQVVRLVWDLEVAPDRVHITYCLQDEAGVCTKARDAFVCTGIDHANGRISVYTPQVVERVVELFPVEDIAS